MAQHQDPRDATAKLWEMIKDIRVAMLTTVDHGHLRARPMWSLQDRFNGSLCFFTRQSSAKMDEIEANHQVNLAYADPNRQNYVSVSGFARLTRDEARMKELWREPMRTWFPDGLDDPDLCLMEVEVEEAEYWDSPSSAMVHLYGYAKAVLTGRPPQPGDNEKVNFQHSPMDQKSWGH